MDVVLYGVGRNLNRAYRTAEAFGVNRLLLLNCGGALLSGNLFKAKDRVDLVTIEDWPKPYGLLALETFYTHSIESVDWSETTTIIVGGETSGLPRQLDAAQKARIPMIGAVSGLTVEAALAIALWEWRRNEDF
jgi:tRNA G18 (ribose-2'-O)-methylase SpoU